MSIICGAQSAWAVNDLSRFIPKNAIYFGQIGAQHVVMQLHTIKQHDIIGRYFILNSLKDYPVAGKINNFSINLLQTFSVKTHPTLSVKLTLFYTPISPDLTGYLITKNGDKEKIKLIPLTITPPSNNKSLYWQKLYAKKPYDYVKLSHLSLKKGNKQQFMGYTLQWWIEPQSKISYFTILSGYPSAVKKKINNTLKIKMWNAILEYNYCQLNGHSLQNIYFKQSVKPTLLSSNLLSINVVTNAFCGGLLPIHIDTPINLNAQTGESLSLKELLWLGKYKPITYQVKDLSPNSEKARIDFFYRNTLLVPWLLQEFQHLYPQRFKNTHCHYKNQRLWSFSVWYLTPQGINFSPYLPFAKNECPDLQWTLSYQIVKKHPGVDTNLLNNL